MGKLVCLGVWFVLLPLAVAKNSVVYDLSPLLTDPSGAIPLIGDKQVRLKSGFTPGAKVLFEDKVPGANWGHPGAIRVIDKNGTLIEEIPTTLPPKDLEEARVLSGLTDSRQAVEFKINDFNGQYRIKDPANYYAVMINGQADQRHWNDYSFLFRVLTQVYGYTKSNIFVADTANKDKAPDLDGDGAPDIFYASSQSAIKELLISLKHKLKRGDHVLLTVNDHGNSVGGESTIVLSDGEMKVSDFSKLINELPMERLLAVYEQCFSGGFVRPTVAPKRVAMAASTNNEYSFASKDLHFDEFIYHVIAAFGRQNHLGTPVNADTNADGQVSAQEAFAYASAMDAAPESPILEAATNSGNSAEIGLAL